jgi:hypothetical protein
MSDTQITIALVVSVSVVIILGCLIVAVVVRLRRVVKSQLETLDNLVSTLHASTLHASQGRDKPGEPS